MVLTHDKDFGELAFARRLPAACRHRVAPNNRRFPGGRHLRAIIAIESRSEWAGQFAIVEDDRIRIRPLPLQP